MRIGQLLGEPLVLALADGRQVPAIRRSGGRLVQIDGDFQLLADPRADAAGKRRAVLERDALDRHERANVGGAHPRMGPVVATHVDHLGRLGNGLEGRLGYRLRRADERHHGPVRVPSRVHVQQCGPRRGLDHAGNLLDLRRILPLGKIRHALDDRTGHYGFSPCNEIAILPTTLQPPCSLVQRDECGGHEPRGREW